MLETWCAGADNYMVLHIFIFGTSWSWSIPLIRSYRRSQKCHEILRLVSGSLGTVFYSKVEVEKISFVAKKAPKDDMSGTILPMSSFGWHKGCRFNVSEIETGRNTSDVVIDKGRKNAPRPRLWSRLVLAVLQI